MMNLQGSMWARAAAAGEQQHRLLARIVDPTALSDFITGTSARTVVVVRNNTLDLLVCAIKDCLSPDARGLVYRAPRDGGRRRNWIEWDRQHKDLVVYTNGTDAKLCTGRGGGRTTNSTDGETLVTLAVIDVRSLGARIRALRSEWGEHEAGMLAALRDMQAPAATVTVVSTEALLGHAHSCAAPDMTDGDEPRVASWHRVLTAWGVEPRDDAIRKVLIKTPGGCPDARAGLLRLPPLPHSSSIFNANEVEHAFATDPALAEFRWMWRPGNRHDP